MKFKLVVVAFLMSVTLFGHTEYKTEVKEGIASYYHDKYHGKKAANGSIFSQDSLTCAHKTLPFGTRVNVKNLSNNKEIQVIVTDRGPFIEGRVIDLSKAAADSIGMLEKGLQKVQYEIVE